LNLCKGTAGRLRHGEPAGGAAIEAVMKIVPTTAALLGAAAVAAAGGYLAGRSDRAVPVAAPVAAFDASLPIDDRIAALEQAVSDERLARQLLQEEVAYLNGELERLSPGPAPAGLDPDAVPDEVEAAAFRPSRRGDPRSDSGEERREALIAAGFLPAQADWLVQREQELLMESLRARFEAERSGEPVDWFANRSFVGDTLRKELGDPDYERYLEGTGRPTTVAVSSVIESSPAQSAGLQAGDQIVRYDGERVFSMTDLTRQTMEGEPGESVVVDIMRGGNLMQVVMPRGPVGITGGRWRY